MRMFDFLSRHPYAPATADAFADGELRGADAAGFERHIQSCAACAYRVAETRALREALAALPPVEAPRSFAITPEMAAAARPARAAARTPVYLTFARAGAALSVAAFATVAAISAFDSSSGTRGPDQAAETLASGGAPAFEAAASDNSSTAGAPLPEATAALAPSTGGDASGSGSGTVAPLASATPVPPATGRDTSTPAPAPATAAPGSRALEDGSLYASSPAAGDADAQSIPKDAFQVGPAEKAPDDDSDALLFGFGGLAVAAVSGLGALELARRRRSA